MECNDYYNGDENKNYRFKVTPGKIYILFLRFIIL